MSEDLQPEPPARIWTTNVFGENYLFWETHIKNANGKAIGFRIKAEDEKYKVEIIPEKEST